VAPLKNFANRANFANLEIFANLQNLAHGANFSNLETFHNREIFDNLAKFWTEIFLNLTSPVLAEPLVAAPQRIRSTRTS
jgi:hypothetical protein